MADSSVSFVVDADTKKAKEDIKKLAKKIKDLEFDTAVKKEKKSILEKKMEAAAKAVEEARDGLKQLKDEQDKLNSVRNISPTEYMQLYENKKKNDAAIKEQEKTVKELEKAYQKEAKAVQKVDESIENNNSTISAAKYLMDEYSEQLAGLKKISEEFSYAMQQIKIGIEGLFKGILNLGKKAITLIAKGIKNTSKIVFTLGNNIVKVIGNLNVFQHVAEKISPTLNRIFNLVKRVFVFSVITSGLRSLRSTLSEWISKNNEFSMSLARTKAALATAFEPIYSHVVPLLTSMLNVLTKVIVGLARFNASLFGKTANEAKKNAQALSSQADATKKAGGAAEKASKQLASFDEINKLYDSSGSDGSGGGSVSGDDITNGFDFEIDNTPIENWGQALSDTLDNVISKINELPVIFDDVSNNINTLSKRFLDAFKFDGVNEKMEEIGIKLSDSFNGLFLKIDWQQIGSAFGAGINILLTSIVGFIYNFDWTEVGNALSKTINGIVDEVDWENFGELLWSGFKIGLETLSGLLLGLNMPKLAKAASDTVKGFFDSAQETIRKIDWSTIGEQIMTFITNIDWVGIAISMLSNAGSIIDALYRFITGAIDGVDFQSMGSNLYDGMLEIIENTDWDKMSEELWTILGIAIGASIGVIWGFIKRAWEDVVKWWHDHAEDEDGNFIWEGLRDGLLEAFGNIKTWIKEHIFQPFINGFKKAFGINSPSTVMIEQGGYIVSGFFDGIIDSLKNISSWIVENVFNPIMDGIKKAFGIDGESSDKFKEIGEALASGIKNGIENGIGAIKGALNGIIDIVETAINWIVSKANSISFTAPDWVPGIGGSKIGFDIPKISIPRLAQGAVIPPNREFMAVLGDQTHGNNIEAPEALLRQMATDAASVNTSLLREIIQLLRDGKVMVVNDTTFAELVFQSNERAKNRHGGSLVSVR